jgi:hypothetical protein
MNSRDPVTPDPVAEDVVTLNREALETSLEMQSVMLETASRLAGECAAFAARRLQASAADAAGLVRAQSPRDVLNWQQQRMQRMIDDYTAESGRFVAIAERAVRDGAEAVRLASRE